MIFISSF